MQKHIFIVLAAIAGSLSVSFTSPPKAPKGKSPVAKASYNANGIIMEVTYCRPYKKGRLIFGEESEKALQPYGKYWRVGANEATVLEVNKDILFNRQELKAGKYQLYAVPGKNTWQIYLNSEWKRWGYAEANHKTDVLKTEVPADNNAPFEEQFTISFENVPGTNLATLVLHWDKTMVRVPFTLKQ